MPEMLTAIAVRNLLFFYNCQGMSIINRLHFGNQKISGNLRKERLDYIILS